VARLNDHLEEAHERGFTALDGRRYAIQERRLRRCVDPMHILLYVAAVLRSGGTGRPGRPPER
jgi:hypothetical protein